MAQTAADRARRAVVLVALPVVFLVATATAAAADQTTTAEARIPFSIAGPVGLGTIAVGLGGLVLGLFRQRRKAAVKVAVKAAEQIATPAPVPSKSQAA